MIAIPDLKIDLDGNGPDTNVLLEQDDGSGTIQRVSLHPVQVRLLAERMGLAPSSNIEAERTIARLCRQMRTLLQRIDQLDDWLNQASLKGHEDLSLETTYSFATWEMAKEFVDQIDEAEAGNTHKSGVIPPGNAPKTGGIRKANPPESGAIARQGQLALPTAEATP